MTLPRDSLGIGLRREHYAQLAEHVHKLDYLEVITENFLTEAPGPRQVLEQARAAVPIVLHGIGLNLLGAAPLDVDYLDRVNELAGRLQAPFVTDHLCWTGTAQVNHHDLLPVPWRRDLVDWTVQRVKQVQGHLASPFGLENLSSYVTFAESDMSEWDFLAEVVRQADCGLMLDINNIYVSSVNHGFDPQAYLRAIDWDRVLQVHVAGHQRLAPDLAVDTHDQPVPDAVWSLYRDAWALGGPFPTLLEWDANIPPLATVIETLHQAKTWRGVDHGR